MRFFVSASINPTQDGLISWPKLATINQSTTGLLYFSDHHTGVLPPLAAESTAIRREVEFLQEYKKSP
jgi:hypothetical protein